MYALWAGLRAYGIPAPLRKVIIAMVAKLHNERCLDEAHHKGTDFRTAQECIQCFFAASPMALGRMDRRIKKLRVIL